MQLDLREITYFGQDWGAVLGLRVAAENEERYARIIIGNGGLPTGRSAANEAFMRWQKFSQTSPAFPIGQLIQGATVTTLTDEVVAAYDAPFPDDSYKAGARIFPTLVPTTPDDPAAPGQPQGVGSAAEVGEAIPDLLQRLRSGHEGRRACDAVADPRGEGPAARDARRRRSFPAGRHGRGTRRSIVVDFIARTS